MSTQLDASSTPRISGDSQTTNATLQTLDQYPVCLAHNMYCGVDLDDLHDKLVMDSSRLFSGQGDIEMWKRLENQEETITQSIFDLNRVDGRQDVIYFIHQATSWSPLQTSSDNLQRLLISHDVSPVFLDALFSFGAKVTGDDDPYFNVCYQHEDNTSFEICYLLRSYEKHNRTTLKNAWSLRQMGVYQKYDHPSATSVWIFIQPFQRCKRALWREFPRTRSLAESIRMHSLLIELTLHDWRWYLNDRRRYINQFTEKATHSSLGYKPQDYKTGFDDVQNLQSVSDSLLLAEHILQSVSEIACMIQRISDTLLHLSLPESQSASAPPVSWMPEDSPGGSMSKNLLAKIQSYLRTANTLQRVAIGTSELLSKLLEYRKAEDSSSLTQTLTTLSAQGNTQTGHLRTLAEEAMGDSRSMSILAVIATIYIPANLVASIFSSGLVQFPNHTDAANIRLLEVQSSMWVYVVSSMVLSGITITVAYAWMRCSGRFSVTMIGSGI